MGQQQQMLLVLGMMIVGIAVSMGIKSYQENADAQYQSQIEQDLQYIATKVMEYYKSPEHLGGGNNSFPPVQVGSSDLQGYFDIGESFSNTNDRVTFQITGATSSTITIQADGLEPLRTETYPQYTLTITGTSYDIAKTTVPSVSPTVSSGTPSGTNTNGNNGGNSGGGKGKNGGGKGNKGGKTKKGN